jgi:surface protein
MSVKIAEYKFDKSIYANLIPEFNAEFTNYEIVDEYLDTEDIVATSMETMLLMDYNAEPDEYGILTTEYEVENVNTFSAENIVTRSIYSSELPTMMRFGNSDSGNTGMPAKYKSIINVLYINTKNLLNYMLMFNGCANLRSVPKISINNKINAVNHMFCNCRSLTSIDVSGFDTSKVTDMRYMFDNCQSLTTIDVSNFDTSNVTNMNHMFNNCNNLTSIDVSNFDTSNVTDMSYMFSDSQNLTSLDISNLDMTNVFVDTNMFNRNYKLSNINVSNCSTNTVNKIIEKLHSRVDTVYGKLYILNNKEHDLIDKATLDAKNWKAVIYGGNIKAVHIPEGMFNSLGLGNVLLKHIHIGERFLED